MVVMTGVSYASRIGTRTDLAILQTTKPPHLARRGNHQSAHAAPSHGLGRRGCSTLWAEYSGDVSGADVKWGALCLGFPGFGRVAPVGLLCVEGCLTQGLVALAGLRTLGFGEGSPL